MKTRTRTTRTRRPRSRPAAVADAAEVAAVASRRRSSGTLEATFDHGDEGYGLWLDPAVQDDPVYAEYWAGHRPVEVAIEEDQIVIRRAGSPIRFRFRRRRLNRSPRAGPHRACPPTETTRMSDRRSPTGSRRCGARRVVDRLAGVRANAAPATVGRSHAAGRLGATRTATSKHQSVPCSMYSRASSWTVNGPPSRRRSCTTSSSTTRSIAARSAGSAAASRRWPSCHRPIRSRR